ncbi:MAG: hypothetical protein J3K34DRAFT_506246 [Monoraphidium minutum]|nr:MAG: hypothetical protein J3K34DRAFT_506246 [Monoraphidium minutum]
MSGTSDGVRVRGSEPAIVPRSDRRLLMSCCALAARSFCGAAAQSFKVLPPGPLFRRRKYTIARFQQAAPDFRDGEWQAALEKPEGRRTKDSAKPLPSMTLSCRAGGAGGAAAAPAEQLRGVPETESLGTYFVLMKQGADFTALPIDQVYGFRPVVTRAKKLTLEEAEEAMRDPAASAAAAGAAAAAAAAGRGGGRGRGGGAPPPAGGGGLDRFAPKSARRAAMEAVDDAVKDEQFKAAYQPSAAQARRGAWRIAAMADELDRPKVVGAEDEDEEYNLWGTDDDEPGGSKRRGGRRGGGRAGGGGGSRRRGDGGGDGGSDDGEGGALGEDEVPEDIYKGEVDELRPQAPDEQNATWEFEEERDDDDVSQGASEDLADDPFTRRELGIQKEVGEDGEERSEEEEEDGDDEAEAGGGARRSAREKERRFQARGGRGGCGGQGASAGELKEKSERAAERIALGEEIEEDEGEEYYGGEGEEEDLEGVEGGEVDFDTLDALERKRSQEFEPPAGARQRSPAPAALRAAGGAPAAQQQPRRTPPPGAAARGATPPRSGGQQQQPRRTPPPAAGAAAAAKRRAGASPPAPSPAAAPAAGDPSAKRQRLTPPPAGLAAAAAAPPPQAPPPQQAAGSGVPTDAEITAALSGGPLTVQQLEFKGRMMRVGEMVPALPPQKGSMVRLKQR